MENDCFFLWFVWALWEYVIWLDDGLGLRNGGMNGMMGRLWDGAMMHDDDDDDDDDPWGIIGTPPVKVRSIPMPISRLEESSRLPSLSHPSLFHPSVQPWNLHPARS